MDHRLPEALSQPSFKTLKQRNAQGGRPSRHLLCMRRRRSNLLYFRHVGRSGQLATAPALITHYKLDMSKRPGTTLGGYPLGPISRKVRPGRVGIGELYPAANPRHPRETVSPTLNRNRNEQQASEKKAHKEDVGCDVETGA